MGKIRERSMEKYRDWAEPGSGINPFVPLHKSSGTLNYVFSLTFGAVLAPLKMLIFYLLWLVLWVFDGIGVALWRIPVVGRLLQRLIETIIARTMLLTLGLYWISSKSVGRKPSAILPGHFILSNYTSYSDVLYLIFRFSPVFAMPAKSGESATGALSVVQMSAARALLRSMSHEPVDLHGAVLLSQVVASAKSRGAPVVFFPEQVKTNGTAVLDLDFRYIGSDTALKDLHAAVFCHTKTRHSLPFPAGGAAMHLFHVMRQGAQQLMVKHVSSNNFSTASPSKVDTADMKERAQKLTRELATAAGVKAVNVRPELKDSFIRYFNTGVKEKAA